MRRRQNPFLDFDWHSIGLVDGLEASVLDQSWIEFLCRAYRNASHATVGDWSRPDYDQYPIAPGAIGLAAINAMHVPSVGSLDGLNQLLSVFW